MFPSSALMKVNTAPAPPPYGAHSPALTAQALGDGHKEEVLQFLSTRPVHTVVMAGFIRDNGLVSPLNRGTFYGCRDEEGRLVGVALIGHVTMVKSSTEAALESFAQLAQDFRQAHGILGGQGEATRFWNYDARAG